MDDITVLVASSRRNIFIHQLIAFEIQNNTYDQEFKYLLLKEQSANTFLDTFIVISEDKRTVRIIYNNKNINFIHSYVQDIGRFHHSSSPAIISHKLSAAQTIFIKVFDFTTDLRDMLLPALPLYHELRALEYTPNQLTSILTKVNRSRPSAFWMKLDLLFRTP